MELPGNICLILYSLMWILSLVLFLHKNRSAGIGGGILIMYAVSSVSSVLFYYSLGLSEKLNIQSFIYLYVFSLICILPLLCYSNKLQSVCFQVSGSGQTFLKFFFLLSFPIVLEAFLEIFNIAIHTSGGNLAAIYDSTEDIIGEKLTVVGRLTLGYTRSFRFIWPLLFFAGLVSSDIRRSYLIVPLLAFCALTMENYAGASRVALVRDILLFVVTFILIYPSLGVKAGKYVKRAVLGAILVFVLFLAVITVNRYSISDFNGSLFSWITLYTGEGPLRFAQYVFDLSNHTNGDYCFSIVRHFLGLDSITDLSTRDAVYGYRLGIPVNIFFTYVGDIVIDFGLGGAAVMSIGTCLLLFLFFKHVTVKSYYSMLSLFVATIVSLIFSFGVTYFVFKVYLLQLDLIKLFAFILVFEFLSRHQ